MAGVDLRHSSTRTPSAGGCSTAAAELGSWLSRSAPGASTRHMPPDVPAASAHDASAQRRWKERDQTAQSAQSNVARDALTSVRGSGCLVARGPPPKSARHCSSAHARSVSARLRAGDACSAASSSSLQRSVQSISASLRSEWM